MAKEFDTLIAKLHTDKAMKESRCITISDFAKEYHEPLKAFGAWCMVQKFDDEMTVNETKMYSYFQMQFHIGNEDREDKEYCRKAMKHIWYSLMAVWKNQMRQGWNKHPRPSSEKMKRLIKKNTSAVQEPEKSKDPRRMHIDISKDCGKSYQLFQKQYGEWCLKQKFEDGVTVHEKKIYEYFKIRFEQGNFRREDKKYARSTLKTNLESLVGLWKVQNTQGWNQHKHPSSQRIKDLISLHTDEPPTKPEPPLCVSDPRMVAIDLEACGKSYQIFQKQFGEWCTKRKFEDGVTVHEKKVFQYFEEKFHNGNERRGNKKYAASTMKTNLESLIGLWKYQSNLKWNLNKHPSSKRIKDLIRESTYEPGENSDSNSSSPVRTKTKKELEIEFKESLPGPFNISWGYLDGYPWWPVFICDPQLLRENLHFLGEEHNGVVRRALRYPDAFSLVYWLGNYQFSLLSKKTNCLREWNSQEAETFKLIVPPSFRKNERICGEFKRAMGEAQELLKCKMEDRVPKFLHKSDLDKTTVAPPPPSDHSTDQDKKRKRTSSSTGSEKRVKKEAIKKPIVEIPVKVKPTAPIYVKKQQETESLSSLSRPINTEMPWASASIMTCVENYSSGEEDHVPAKETIMKTNKVTHAELFKTNKNVKTESNSDAILQAKMSEEVKTMFLTQNQILEEKIQRATQLLQEVQNAKANEIPFTTYPLITTPAGKSESSPLQKRDENDNVQEISTTVNEPKRDSVNIPEDRSANENGSSSSPYSVMKQLNDIGKFLTKPIESTCCTLVALISLSCMELTLRQTGRFGIERSVSTLCSSSDKIVAKAAKQLHEKWRREFQDK